MCFPFFFCINIVIVYEKKDKDYLAVLIIICTFAAI